MMLEGTLYETVCREGSAATVRLLPESPVYKAHFPGYPITPGVTIVQMALELTGRELAGAKDIRFLVPVLPSEEGTLLRFEWSLDDPEKLNVNVFLNGDILCSKMTLWLKPLPTR